MREGKDLSQTLSLATPEKMVKSSSSKLFAVPDDICNQHFWSLFPVPLEAPLNVGILMENSTAIKVTWAPIDKETVRGRLLGYKVPPARPHE